MCSHRIHHLAACLVATAGLAAATGNVRAESPAAPNIVLILADDLGYGDLGCFGQQQLLTPRLDAMAEEGMRLTQFYAGGTVCAPSRSVLMTGQHAGHTVVRGNSMQPIMIQPGQPTLASVLKGAGYATACVGKWGIGNPDNVTNPNDVGFDHFFGYVNMWHAHNFYPEFLIRNGEVVKLRNVAGEKWQKFQDPAVPQAGMGVAAKRVDYAPDLFVEEALGFIRENKAKPFFLYFAMNVPHANNEGGQHGMEVPDLGDFAANDWPEPEKGFASMIRNIDRDTGRVLDLLKEQWFRKSTLYWEFYEGGSAQAVRFGKWKAIRQPMFTGPIALYDLSNDLGEKNDTSKRRPDLIQHAANLLDKAHVPDPNWQVKPGRAK